MKTEQLNDRLYELKRHALEQRSRFDARAQPPPLLPENDLASLTWMQLAAQVTCRMCALEQPVIHPGERIAFTRTVPSATPLYAAEIARRAPPGATLHELGPVSNICADWGMALSQGLLGRREVALASRARVADDPQAVEFLDAAVQTIDALLELVRRYAAAAAAAGRDDLAAILTRVPAGAPRTFHEALQSLRILHAAVWMSGNYHVGLGRFDQYMWPYLQADLESGRLDLVEAEELLCEFFIALNRDSHLYPGVQQGDNGQTLTIGGLTRDGRDGCNELTRMVLRAARDVSMIDPKINLRISPETDLELLALATELTRKGLGFPQYSNDAVVIPALAAHGYDLEDARDYTVAACWEFIIPGKGMEVVNIGAVSLPFAADRAIRLSLANGESADQMLRRVREQIQIQVESLVEPFRRLFLPPAPYYSVLMDGCLESGRDLSQGLKYNNFGVHGACSANAADALAAVIQLVHRQQSVTPREMLDGLDSDFTQEDGLRQRLQREAPKVACNSDLADEMLVFLFDAFAEACEAVEDNGRGGIVRPGTGSAMFYLWLARGHQGMREPVVGATADGRRRGEPFGANLSPSPGVQADGLFSLLQSFSRIDYRRVCNGGPVTIELSDGVFRDDEAVRKVAMLVRTFAHLGCQQLQLNSINAETLQEAKKHPELHRNLIVRVWGWSGYFCELDPEYQDHIIARTLYD